MKQIARQHGANFNHHYRMRGAPQNSFKPEATPACCPADANRPRGARRMNQRIWRWVFAVGSDVCRCPRARRRIGFGPIALGSAFSGARSMRSIHHLCDGNGGAGVVIDGGRWAWMFLARWAAHRVADSDHARDRDTNVFAIEGPQQLSISMSAHDLCSRQRGAVANNLSRASADPRPQARTGRSSAGAGALIAGALSRAKKPNPKATLEIDPAIAARDAPRPSSPTAAAGRPQ